MFAVQIGIAQPTDSWSDQEIVMASALPKPQNPMPALVAFLSAIGLLACN